MFETKYTSKDSIFHITQNGQGVSLHRPHLPALSCYIFLSYLPFFTFCLLCFPFPYSTRVNSTVTTNRSAIVSI